MNEARSILSGAKTALKTKVVQVKYAANELAGLATQLLGNQRQWAGATGIGGGYEPQSNRVVLQVDRGYKDASGLIAAIDQLNDPRVSRQLVESVAGWMPEVRVDNLSALLNTLGPHQWWGPNV
ncbi:hypothetical protein [Arthrobacter sp. HLT1-20]